MAQPENNPQHLSDEFLRSQIALYEYWARMNAVYIASWKERDNEFLANLYTELISSYNHVIEYYKDKLETKYVFPDLAYRLYRVIAAHESICVIYQGFVDNKQNAGNPAVEPIQNLLNRHMEHIGILMASRK